MICFLLISCTVCVGIQPRTLAWVGRLVMVRVSGWGEWVVSSFLSQGHHWCLIEWFGGGVSDRVAVLP